MVAEKYNVPLLKDLAQKNFVAVLQKDSRLAIINIPVLVEAISIIFNETLSSNRGLRVALNPILFQFKTRLRAHEGFMALVNTGLGEGDFAVQVLDVWGDLRRIIRSEIGRSSKCKTERFSVGCLDCDGQAILPS